MEILSEKIKNTLTMDTVREAHEKLWGMTEPNRMNSVNRFNGLKIVISDCFSLLNKQFKFSKSHKKRIRKKFAKNKENYRKHLSALVDKTTGTIYMSQELRNKIRVTETRPETIGTII